MRRIALVLLAVMAFAFGFTAPAGAQDIDCPDISYEEAQDILAQDPDDPHGLDADNDGEACEDNASGGSGSGTGSENTDDADTGGTTQLPDTGTGSGIGSADSAVSLLAIAAAVMLVLGAVARRGEWLRL